MQQSLPTQPSLAASSFAGLLATLTAPQPAAIEDESLWSSSDLGEDVASLSYERALRAHARYRPANRASGLPIPAEGFATHAETDAATGAAQATAGERATPESSKTQDHDLRTASVTIRLSKIECARLRERAAEAGLTISAYLRSCALEAETLRAEVKRTLAELKTAAETPTPAVQTRKPWFGWIGRIRKH
jgi:predicted DNA binding CopG/RHH family protein